MDENEVSYPIHVILDGITTIFRLTLCLVFKGHKLWIYVTRQHMSPIQKDGENANAFVIWLKD